MEGNGSRNSSDMPNNSGPGPTQRQQNVGPSPPRDGDLPDALMELVLEFQVSVLPLTK